MLSVAILRSQVGCKHPAGQAAVPSVLASTSHVGVDAAVHTQAVPEQSAASHVVWSVEVLSEHDATTCVAVPVHEAVPVHDATANATAQLGYVVVSVAVPVQLASIGRRQSGVVKVSANSQGLVSATLMASVSPGRNATVAERETCVDVQPDGHASVPSVVASKSQIWALFDVPVHVATGQAVLVPP